MKKIFIISAIAAFNICATAQTLNVVSIDELTNDISARANVRLDDELEPCALLRVQLPSLDKLNFDQSAIGEVKNMPGEFQLYIKQNSPQLSFLHEGIPYSIIFSNYGITIEGKKCYRIILQLGKNNNIASNTETHIRANYDNIAILVDGAPIGETPLHLSNISPGMHLISVPNRNGITMADTIVNIAKGENNINLTLHEEDPKYFKIDWITPGGDTGGWEIVWGLNESEHNGKHGLIDYAGNQIVPNEYDAVWLYDLANGCRMVGNKISPDSWECHVGLYHPQKGLMIDPTLHKYTNLLVKRFEDDSTLISFAKDNKWGICDSLGNIMIPAKFENSPLLSSDNKTFTLCEKTDDYRNPYTYTIFDQNCNEIISTKLERLGKICNGQAIFSDYRGQYGYGIFSIDGSRQYFLEQYRIPDNWLYEQYLIDDMIPIQDKTTKKYGFINKNMDLLIPPKYEEIVSQDYDAQPPFQNGIEIVKDNGNLFVIDSHGDVILNGKSLGLQEIRFISINDWGIYDGEFDRLRSNRKLIHATDKNAKQGIFDLNGNVIIPLEYDDCEVYFDNGESFYVVNNIVETDEPGSFDESHLYKYKIFDKNLKLIAELPENYGICAIADGFIQIINRETGQYGYLSTTGEILANCIYGYESDEIENIDENSYQKLMDSYEISSGRIVSDGLAMLILGDRIGFMDNKGQVVVPLIYTAATPFNRHGITFLRDQNGEWVKKKRSEIQ